jgi:hypothetical protein
MPDMSDEEAAAQQWDRAEAMRHLPGSYSLALRLRDAGLTNELIAECLAVELQALDLLLRVAEAKLAMILQGEHDEGVSSRSHPRLFTQGGAISPPPVHRDGEAGTHG